MGNDYVDGNSSKDERLGLRGKNTLIAGQDADTLCAGFLGDTPLGGDGRGS